ncbi:MAG: hypothetical protein L0Y58_18345 [Verrucomicrobia subdivision 3 bacterium]|nr:hypothetical protein [Limisphaerales bacterium]
MKRLVALHSNAVWPPGLLVIGFILLYGGFNAAILAIELMLAVPFGELSRVPDIAEFKKFILMLSAAAYAAYRLWRFHPACNPAYAAWLKLSPWTADKPLPLGPLHLVWQDAVVVGTVLAIAKWHAHVNPLWPAIAFVLFYFAGFTIILIGTRRRAACAIFGFLWPAMILPLQGWQRLLLMAAFVVVIWRGHLQSLRAFPWEFLSDSPQPWSKPKSIWQTNIQAVPSQLPARAGWPFAVLAPKLESRSISLKTTWTVSLILGWCIFCILIRAQAALPPEMILVAAIFGAIFRLAIYCKSPRTPLQRVGTTRGRTPYRPRVRSGVRHAIGGHPASDRWSDSSAPC